MIPLYEEAGVYNFYVKAGTNKGKVEIIGETDLQSMTREDLEKEVAAMRARSGFPGSLEHKSVARRIGFESHFGQRARRRRRWYLAGSSARS